MILDADETVLDNSEYQRRLAIAHAPFDPKSWTAWVNEHAAPAIPGAPEFAKLVHSLGGRIVIVTNRSQAECEPTRANLQQAEIDADMVLCQPPGEGNKNPRFLARAKRNRDAGDASADRRGVDGRQHPGLSQSHAGRAHRLHYARRIRKAFLHHPQPDVRIVGARALARGEAMKPMTYAFTAIPDDKIPRAAEPAYQHMLDTYVSETNKVATVWRQFHDEDLVVSSASALDELSATSSRISSCRSGASSESSWECRSLRRKRCSRRR